MENAERSSDQQVSIPAERLPVWRQTQILVVGGGVAGVAAATSAARLGANVTLIERYGHLGGLATGGLIILLLTMDDGAGHQVVGGLCQELVDRLALRNAAIFPAENERYSSDPRLVDHWAQFGLRWGKGPHHVRYSVAFDPEEFIFLANELMEQSGIHLLFHTQAVHTIREGPKIRGVVVQGGSKRGAILADVLIDATGDGDVFALAGGEFELQKVVPWLWFRVGNAGEEAISDSGPLKVFRTARPREALVVPWGGAFALTRAIDPTDVEELTWAEIACRKKIAEIFQTKLKELPGLDQAYVSHVATQLGITESRRLIGRRILAQNEVNTHFTDSIGCTGNWSKYHQFYEIPYPCLLSRDFENLLVAGRCISVDHLVHHSTKEIPACMVTGEAAGTAAALAIQAGIQPVALDVSCLRQQLIRQGVYLEAPFGEGEANAT